MLVLASPHRSSGARAAAEIPHARFGCDSPADPSPSRGKSSVAKSTDSALIRGTQSGQAIVEFAVSALVILLLLLAILQFALLYNAQIGLENGVRDATRYGSSLTANSDATAATQADATWTYLTASLGNHVTPYSAARLATGSQVCYEGYTDANGQPAVRVRVTALYQHPLVVPLIAAILDPADGAGDGFFVINSTAEMRVDNPAEPIPAVTSTPPVCN